LAEAAVKPERSVWLGLPRSISHTTPSAALTLSCGCGGAIETETMVPVSVLCSSSAHDQP
jgi:hypothetical protein